MRGNNLKLQLRRQLTLQRGHWLEYGVAQALNAHNLHMLPQVELTVPKAPAPIKIHMDFVLVDDRVTPTVRVLELKSTATLPTKPRPQHKNQVEGQVSLLASYWNKRCFAVRDADGNVVFDKLSFPQLCKQQFGIDMPKNPAKVDIQGWLLCVSMKEATAFGAYLPSEEVTDACLQQAEYLWLTMQDYKKDTSIGDMLPTVIGYSPLCEYCDMPSHARASRRQKCRQTWQIA